ncbi:hypothetical protein EVAR_55792_1 [Eumeta japonica]|uniref:Uncharacterized protein n=1 Tax=Eumeta variegata TaxID=151549 RepID=A0A4C1YP38_EUMVA|nr:hypothetical protein EVAR_55792_1 [Eumeta japonica]
MLIKRGTKGFVNVQVRKRTKCLDFVNIGSKGRSGYEETVRKDIQAPPDAQTPAVMGGVTALAEVMQTSSAQNTVAPGDHFKTKTIKSGYRGRIRKVSVKSRILDNIELSWVSTRTESRLEPPAFESNHQLGGISYG